MSTKRNMLDPHQIDALEGRLAGTLKPVVPPTDFVQRLRGHIRIPENNVLVLRMRDWERLGLMIGGVLSGTLVIITVARALYHLFGRRNVG